MNFQFISVGDEAKASSSSSLPSEARFLIFLKICDKILKRGSYP